MLCSSFFSRIVNNSKADTAKSASFILYIGCLLTLFTASIVPDNALKFFIFCAVIALIVLFQSRDFLITNKKAFLLPCALLAFGLMQVIWVAIFKEHGSIFTATYRSYQNGGKVLIFSAFIIAALHCPASQALRKAPFVNNAIIVIGFCLYSYAGWQLYSIGGMKFTTYRVTLGLENATGTAYALTLVALLVSQSILNMQFRYNVFFYFVHFIISLAAIISTQTRAAIIVYPVLCIALFFLHFRHNKKIVIGSCLSFILLIFVASIPFKPILDKRYAEFKNDLHEYDKNKSNTSVGARLAMQQAGLGAGKQHLWGQSLESRDNELLMQAKANPLLKSALTFKRVHLHNELIDTFSLKGLPGILLLMALYIAMFSNALTHRSILILLLSGAIFSFGLSDLLFYAKSEALNSMITLCAAFMILPKTLREEK
ncbi:O-antigen ligase family protein [Enterobacteriaceae bacterium YMB-R22]|uniref:O-antigen ligase family protein n=1 Tax=Tenebrionicola larvae TaxID=2815733 RepID=UPI0020115F91|nr:O-antigen ligase family protein [Tenebrionicola larvae]MBV4414259.1 O-antigen ligase family protein [Tenebrionicola larvae]